MKEVPKSQTRQEAVKSAEQFAWRHKVQEQSSLRYEEQYGLETKVAKEWDYQQTYHHNVLEIVDTRPEVGDIHQQG